MDACRTSPRWFPARKYHGSRLAQEAGLQHQALDLVGVALDVLSVALDQPDVADHRALLERDRAAFHLQVLDHHHRVALGERVDIRSEKRRVGQGGVSTCRFRWTPYN